MVLIKQQVIYPGVLESSRTNTAENKTRQENALFGVLYMRFRSHGRGGRHLTLTPNITSPHPPGLHSTRKAGVAGDTFSALFSLLLLLIFSFLI